MAKPKLKSTPQSKLLYNVIRNYRGNFNSSKLVAETYGVSTRTIRRWLADIRENKNPVRNEARAQRYLDRAEQALPLLSQRATEEAKLLSKKKGKDMLFLSYELKPGAKLPDNVATRNVAAYQIIVKDRYGHKMTSIVGTWKAASENMRKKMSEYSKFHATEIIVTTRTRGRHITDAEADAIK